MTGELRSAGGRACGASADLSALEPGTHLIALYQGDAELARVAGVFVGAGLAAGDRVLYVAGRRSMTGTHRPIRPYGRAPQDASSGCGSRSPPPVTRGIADLMGRGHLFTDMGVV